MWRVFAPALRVPVMHQWLQPEPGLEFGPWGSVHVYMFVRGTGCKWPGKDVVLPPFLPLLFPFLFILCAHGETASPSLYTCKSAAAETLIPPAKVVDHGGPLPSPHRPLAPRSSVHAPTLRFPHRLPPSRM